MSARLTRRAVLGGAMLAAASSRARAQALPEQGFAGLGQGADAYAKVVPGRALTFPLEHGAHPEFRIEWWYITANLMDASGARYGAQWTLFRQAMTAHDEGEGWSSRQFWMGHAAVTSAAAHRFAETLSRGGVGTAGIDLPFNAWIDNWQAKADDGFDGLRVSPLNVSASASDFRFALRLEADAPLALQGDAGYSRKSDQGQASYYYSQPFFRAAGRLSLSGREVDVSGQAWLDHEWSSQPLSGDQSGWDWLSLHLQSGERLMLFRLREATGAGFVSGNWIAPNAAAVQLAAADVSLTPLNETKVAGRAVPTSWRIAVASRNFDVTLTPLNPQSWMGTRFPYWEGPVSFSGSTNGVGYLEMTGY